MLGATTSATAAAKRRTTPPSRGASRPRTTPGGLANGAGGGRARPRHRRLPRLRAADWPRPRWTPIEAHSLHCAAETSEAWAHAARRCRDDPDGRLGRGGRRGQRGRGKGVVAAVVRKPGSKLAIKLAKDAPPSWAQPRFDVRFATGLPNNWTLRGRPSAASSIGTTEAEARHPVSSARADRLERELEEARRQAAQHARQAARAEAALARARINEDDARLCAVCLDAPKDAAFVPCGHRTCRILRASSLAAAASPIDGASPAAAR